MKNSIDKIYLYPGYVDLRKGMNNLGYLAAQIVCLKDIHLDNVRIFGQGVQKFVQLNLYTAL